jgi:4,5:9,10-diseco-3-hydroxy-5,9,17-trioxoandrosta-1(10),2-diene-4-oate hydrolase
MKDLFATGLMYNPEHATDELVAERMQIMEIMKGHVMATMKVPVLVDRLAEIDCPVLGFWGMDEQMMPENGIMAMAKNMKHLRFILVTECGHWVMVEHEDMFNRMCLDFLQHS